MEKIKIDNIKTFSTDAVLTDIKEKLFDKNEIPFLVVGSLALQESGFDVIPNDIDIEAICTEEQENILSILSASCGNDYYENDYEDSEAEKRMENVTWKHKPFIFQWQEFSINVWAVEKFSHPYFLNEEGIKFAKPLSVLKKKMAYGRTKDQKTFANIVKQVVNINK